MKLFLTGGSGFVGSAVLRLAVARGHQVNALVTRGKLQVESPLVTEIQGDLFDAATLDRGMSGVDAVIHLVGIIVEVPAKGVTFQRIHVEGTRAVVDAARRNHIARYVLMSAMGSRERSGAGYHQTKFGAEQYVRASELDYTVIQPSMIHGPGGFMKQLAGWARGKAFPYIAMPYFGAGLLGYAGVGRVQPVHVDDVARAFLDALDKPATIGKTYELGGADRLTWPDFYAVASTQIIGEAKHTLAIPRWYADLLTYVVPGKWLPFNRSQVSMALEDNTGDNAPLERDFGWSPRGFSSTLAEYAAQL